MTPKYHSLKVNAIQKETEDTVSIAFDVPKELAEDYAYVAGQYLTFKKEIDGEDVRRSYSLCSAPYENKWRVAVKQVPEGKFSSFANNSLQKGDTLEVMTPTGSFTFEANTTANNSYVLFAAGSGITPVLAILKTILHEEPNSDVTLFFGNSSFSTIIFREEIEALKNKHMDRFRLVHILSRESLGNNLQEGRITTEKVKNLYHAFLSHVEIAATYVCGPEQVIHSVKDGFMELGVAEENIHFELFTTPGENIAKPIENYEGPKVSANVTIIIDGDKIAIPLESDGEKLLNAAQKAGADLPFACKGGVCSTCKAKIVEGSVHMEVNYALEKEEVDAGYILTCQSHPTSEKLTVSFDD